VVDRLNETVEQAFDDLVCSVDYPMWIVTTVAADDGELSGCLVGFGTQCSIHPPRYLACISTANHTARIAGRAEVVAAHLVPNEHRALVDLFGHETGDTVDKFASCSWTPGPRGVPLLEDCPARFVGEILERMPLGDHTGYLVQPVLAEGRAPAEGYVCFQDVKGMDPGHPA